MIRLKIPTLRMFTIFVLFSSRLPDCSVPKNPYGIRMLLLSIVESPIEETTIIEIAAENPPRNTITVIALLPISCGMSSE